jgi:hypothetical protein
LAIAQECGCVFGIQWQWRNRGWLAFVLAIVLGLGVVGCGGDRPKVRSSAPAPGSASSLGAKLAEVSPPAIFQELRPALDNYKPQVKILSPRPDEVLKETQAAVRLQVKDFLTFKNEDLGLGPHLHFILDNQPYQAIYDPDQPINLTDLSPGSHTIRLFASRPWHESFKNEGAYAQTTFHVFTKTATNHPLPDQPLLTYSRPEGTYGAEPILLDFYLNNVPLHLIAQEDPDDDILDWKIRCTVNGTSFVLDKWQPIYLKGFKPGQNWVQLELLDEKGNLFPNVFNDTVRLIHYEPGGQDTLSKLVRGELAIADVRGIVDPTYTPEIPEPEPEISPVAPPTPAPSPSPTLSPSPAPIETPSFEPVPVPSLVLPEVNPQEKPVKESSSTKPQPVIEPELAEPELAEPELVEPELEDLWRSPPIEPSLSPVETAPSTPEAAEVSPVEPEPAAPGAPGTLPELLPEAPEPSSSPQSRFNQFFDRVRWRATELTVPKPTVSPLPVEMEEPAESLDRQEPFGGIPADTESIETEPMAPEAIEEPTPAIAKPSPSPTAKSSKFNQFFERVRQRAQGQKTPSAPVTSPSEGQPQPEVLENDQVPDLLPSDFGPTVEPETAEQTELEATESETEVTPAIAKPTPTPASTRFNQFFERARRRAQELAAPRPSATNPQARDGQAPDAVEIQDNGLLPVEESLSGATTSGDNSSPEIPADEIEPLPTSSSQTPTAASQQTKPFHPVNQFLNRFQRPRPASQPASGKMPTSLPEDHPNLENTAMPDSDFVSEPDVTSEETSVTSEPLLPDLQVQPGS